MNPLDTLEDSNPQGRRIPVTRDFIMSDKTRVDGIRFVSFLRRKWTNGYSAHNGFSYVTSWAVWNGKEWFHGERRKDALEKMNDAKET